ncbi:hypothetical protein MtrunA17_Chr4g0052391 [Medicago truncatula]|uniref:Uncharacterized protein n=1 Tax=Medicago truncatula TaxID=3880 RepID=A0A396IBA1_MEDTR|nr:hypothetical protein MtrunA17_Chr4g0052391 [Medicago truncatula]
MEVSISEHYQAVLGPSEVLGRASIMSVHSKFLLDREGTINEKGI